MFLQFFIPLFVFSLLFKDESDSEYETRPPNQVVPDQPTQDQPSTPEPNTPTVSDDAQLPDRPTRDESPIPKSNAPAKADDTSLPDQPTQDNVPVPKPNEPADPDDIAVPLPDQPDDLTRLHGIGPQTAAQLRAAGISTFRQLADTSEARLLEIIGGARGYLSSWARQARMASEGAWHELEALIDTL